MVRRFLAKALCCVLVFSFLVLGGCASSKQTSQVSEQQAQQVERKWKGQELKLYVAAGMKKPMDAVIKKFEEQTGAKVVVNYGASGQLWTQIREGQPCDLFYSADWIYIEKAQNEGKAAESKKFLKDKLVLVVSKSGKAKIKSMNDLAKQGVNFVIADPQAPVGVYAENALKNLGLWDKVRQNLKARPSTVNQVAIMVKEDQVDAGLIYSSVAKGNGLEVVQALDERLTGEIIFGAAVIKGGNEALAKDFLEFSVKHADEFTKYGWTPYE